MYVRERILYSMRSLTVERFENRSGVRELGSFNNCTSESFGCVEVWIAVSNWGDCNIVSCSNRV